MGFTKKGTPSRGAFFYIMSSDLALTIASVYCYRFQGGPSRLQIIPLSRLCVAAAIFFGCLPVAFGAQSACNLPIYRLCIESPTLDLAQECARNGGDLGYACSVEQRIGSCAKKQGEHSVYLRYYQGVTFDPVKNCKDNGGVYTPG